MNLPPIGPPAGDGHRVDDAASLSLQAATPPGDGGKSVARAGLARRRLMLALIMTGAVLLAAGGLGAAAFLKSPAQVAAETAAPRPDVLTAPVERRELAQTLVTRGQVTAAQSFAVASSGPSGADAGRAVVTKVKVRAGDSVVSGKLLLEISGRPVFALPGALPAYRDLRAGLHGDDVAQLQHALAAVGHGRGSDRLGAFGPGTQHAVTAFYAAVGYEPVEAAAKSDPAAKVPAPGGPSVPASEVVYLGAFPARVETVAAVVGTAPSDKLLTISAGALVVNGSVAAYEKGLIRAGQKVQLFSEITGAHATGTVAAITVAPQSTAPDAAASSTPKYVVRVKPDRALPASWAGQDVRLNIAAASSGGKVLVVPSSAISSGADGRTTVSVTVAGGSARRVEVRTGMSGDGFVQVTPASGTLTAGEHVIVGVAPIGATGSTGGTR